MVWVFMVHLACTWFMVGLIWLVQIVHYPLFAMAGRGGFAAYEARHTALITWVVLPPMLLELATAALFVWLRPFGLPAWWAWMGLALVGVIWLSTFALQVPQHAVLAQGFDARAHRLLVDTNWIRTIAWTARGILVSWPLAVMLSRLPPVP